jgi:hypothetical protein
MIMNNADILGDGRKSNTLKKSYAPPKLLVYGKVGKLTRSGASGTAEAPGKSPTKRA